jgi:hypothetical protein
MLQPIVQLVTAIGNIINLLIPILIGAAVVVFFYGLILYIWGNSGESNARGRHTMIAGLGALFVMVSVWGLINLAQGALGVNPNGSVNAPYIPPQSGPR